MTETRPLGGAHAVITGASGGIGFAIAAELGRLGAHLTLMGRSTARLESARQRLPADQGQSAHVEPLDVTDYASVERAFASAVAAQGPVLILVNNAGAAESAPFRKTDASLWRRMFEVNLDGAYRCTACVIDGMLARGSGRIVNIASTAGLRGYPYVTAYCAAKHGLVGFTRALARELAGSGITVNAVCPGYTDTDFIARSVQHIATRSGRSPADVRATLVRSNPSGRLVQPDEVAALAAWLCLPANAMLTGQAIALDGGELA
jgi:NAD(P)-dependent dehydrogenase (short-subunit alcohol dehydrogenase family)